MGMKDERKKEDAGVERGSPLICLNSKTIRKIKSNGERSREACKQGLLAIPQRKVLGQRKKSRLFRDSACLESFYRPVTETICIEPHS